MRFRPPPAANLPSALAVTEDPIGAPASAAPEVTFEVERFEWTADDRLEVAGQWFGVRGRRFLRPTLDIEVDGQPHRMLAVLDHKPWAADDGEDWVAAFAWKGEPVELAAVELAVGPDLAVPLPLPGTSGRSRKRARPARSAERQVARRPRAAQLETALADARSDAKRARDELDQARAAHAEEAEQLRHRFTAEQKAAAGLAAELKEARDQIAAAEAAAEERVEEAQRERDAAIAARGAALANIERVERERDAAFRARDEARQERNAWLSQARTAALQRDSAVTERDAAAGERDTARAEREAAIAARDNAAAERDTAERALAKSDTAHREAVERDARRGGGRGRFAAPGPAAPADSAPAAPAPAPPEAVPPEAAPLADPAASPPPEAAPPADPASPPPAPAEARRAPQAGERRTVVIGPDPATAELDRRAATRAGVAEARTAVLDSGPDGAEPSLVEVWGPRAAAVLALLALVVVVAVLIL